MTNRILNTALALTIAFNGAFLTHAQAQIPAGAQPVELTIDQKIALVGQLKAEIKAKKDEVRTAGARIVNGKLVYRISYNAGFIAGLTGFVTFMNGSANLKTTNGKIFWGSLLTFLASVTVREQMADVIELREQDKNKLLSELNTLEQKLSGLELGLQFVSNIN